MTLDDEQRAARRELSVERWKAHREAHDGEKELEGQKWEAHSEQHASIARNLAEYKAQSNEWRGSLSDLRATFASRLEVEGLEGRLSAFREELRAMIATEREERREQQNLRSGAVDTWKWIAGFLGVGGVGAIVWALLQQAP